MSVDAEITTRRDLILAVDPDVRAWLDATGFPEPVPADAKVGVTGEGRAYVAIGGKPCRLPGAGGHPVPPLPDDLVARAEVWLVAEAEVDGATYGCSKRVREGVVEAYAARSLAGWFARSLRATAAA